MCDVDEQKPLCRRTVAISVPRYVETVLYGNRVLRVSRYRRVDCKLGDRVVISNG